jgi:putative membrane protein
MHIFNGGWLWGMHFMWWSFWLVFVVIFFVFMKPVPRNTARETPMQILRRRYAAGAISSEEYEERKAKLDRDSDTARQRP